MFCSFCGKSLDQDVKFCSFCGKELPASQETAKPEAPVKAVEVTAQPVEAPRLAQVTPVNTVEATLLTGESSPQAPRSAAPARRSKPSKRTGRSILFGLIGVVMGAVILAAVLFFTGMISFGSAKSGGASGDKIEGSGYDTPEDAAKAYLEALKDQDVDAMLATFAVESYAENYDLAAMYKRLQAYTPTLDMKLPAGNAYINELNVGGRRAGILRQITRQYISHNVNSIDMTITMLFNDEPDLVSKIEKDTDHYVFSDLVITGTMAPEDLTDIYLDEQCQKNMVAQSKPYGVDNVKDIANVVITFEADGESWYFCPQLIQYEGRWYIQDLSGTLSALLGVQMDMMGIMKAN